MPQTRSRTRRLTRPALVLLALAVAGGAAPASAGTPGLTLTGRGDTGQVVTGERQVAVGGSTRVALSVDSVAGGEATVVRGPGRGLDRAVRFPRFVASGDYPRAVLATEPLSGAALDPGAGAFAFGAVLRLARSSDGRPEDDGDNVLQRGLYGDGSQFKLQLDRARPSCTVRGARGRVTVQAATTVRRGTWYTVRCVRRDGGVTVRVAPYDRSAPAVRRTASGATGALSFDPGTPASVGGKLDSSGHVVAGSTDQFNGAVAKVWVKPL